MIEKAYIFTSPIEQQCPASKCELEHKTVGSKGKEIANLLINKQRTLNTEHLNSIEVPNTRVKVEQRKTRRPREYVMII